MYAVIIAGGRGERFWPASRSHKPKQFLSMVGKITMLRATYDRIIKIVPAENIIVVTNKILSKRVQDLIPELKSRNILIEPKARNTAPAIGLAALYIRDIDADAVMAVFPADHVIRNQTKFAQAVKRARKTAERTDGLVTIGITPKGPETAYGYIQAILTQENQGSYKVRAFAEKPTYGTAKRFIKSGDFFWNSGMFIWKASAILREMEENIPEIYEPLAKLSGHFNSKGFAAKLKKAFSVIRATSIDYAVMEVSQNVHMVIGEFEWNDLGSWEALYSLSRKDKQGNVIDGDAITIDTTNTLIKASGKFVATIGLKNMIVVATDDAFLVAPRDKAQEIKDMVESLKKGSFKKYL
ncbi:MAG: mannose-1-phosphate guanylyltransferase [Candidatus Marinimicrobia bacterium]|nr:mannose-1-phosphate guanylyltransferase [Candidatus Neomarinimicrobiota bacterium]